MIIEQKCKISDTEILENELLNMTTDSRKEKLKTDRIHSTYFDLVDYFDLELIEKLNADKIPIFTFEKFTIGSSKKIKDIVIKNEEMVSHTIQVVRVTDYKKKINDKEKAVSIFEHLKKNNTQNDVKNIENIDKRLQEICKNNSESKNQDKIEEAQKKETNKTISALSNNPNTNDEVTDNQVSKLDNQKQLNVQVNDVLKKENEEEKHSNEDLDENTDQILAKEDIKKPHSISEEQWNVKIAEKTKEILEKVQINQNEDRLLKEHEMFIDELDSDWQNLKLVGENLEDDTSFDLKNDNYNILFMVHGLGGSPDDFRFIRSMITFKIPDINIHTVLKGVDTIRESIVSLGTRFAKEVTRQLDQITITEKTKIHFFGHSMGGLIIRSALPLLTKYSQNFVTYISHCTPHLGAELNNSALKIGANFYGMFLDSKSMMEMFQSNNTDFIEQLSQIKEFSSFKNVVLIFNYDDGFVQPSSSRIVMEESKKKSESYSKSLRNFYGNCKAQQVYKIGISCPGIVKGFDKILGRNSHMFFLTDYLSQRIVVEEIRQFLE